MVWGAGSQIFAIDEHGVGLRIDIEVQPSSNGAQIRVTPYGDHVLRIQVARPNEAFPMERYPDMVERNPVDISPEQLKFIQDHGSSVLTEKFYTDQMRITAETILPLIDEPLLPILVSAASGGLEQSAVSLAADRVVGVVLASAGYPDSSTAGQPISGIAAAESIPGVAVYHAGIEQGCEGKHPETGCRRPCEKGSRHRSIVGMAWGRGLSYIKRRQVSLP